MKPSRFRPSLAPMLLLAVVVTAVVFPHAGLAQDSEDDDDGGGPSMRHGGGGKDSAEFRGHLQIVKAPGAKTPAGNSKFGGIDIFPEARRMPMSVHNTDPVPIERARRGGEWLCTKQNCTSKGGPRIGDSIEGDNMLKSIKVRTPAMPVPVTIWRRIGDSDAAGTLDFDPGLLSQWSYTHVCAYGPIEGEGVTPPTELKRCVHGTPGDHRPDQGEILLGLEWPREAELAGFKYLAVADSCGNAMVFPFTRTLSVPAIDVVSGGCNTPDGQKLRIFPSGSFLRVTAFNLDAPAADETVQVTYRVSVPPLENYAQANPAKLLFPDFKLNELLVDCGPMAARGPVDPSGKPINPNKGQIRQAGKPQMLEVAPPPPPDPDPKRITPEPPPGPPKPPEPPVPGEEPPIDPGDEGNLSPPAGPPPPPLGLMGYADAPPDSSAVAGSGPPTGPGPKGAGPTAQVGVSGSGNTTHTAPHTDEGVGAKTLNHGTLVIAPEPLRDGNCRIIWKSNLRSRLNVPLALRVELYRTDKTDGNEPVSLIPEDQSQWIVTQNDYTYTLPALRSGFDGDSRLKLIVRSDPMNQNGKVVLVGDAGRVAAMLHQDGGGDEVGARRTVGSVTIHTVPLCGESNFETLEEAGSCVRAYLTIPAMLATLQITRAPWVEKPLITRAVLSAVGVALAFDSYDPVERAAFPIAGQVGGFIQNLEDNRLGLMAYAGVAPTLPILGDGGNTTTFGFLAGLGIMYITNSDGPDEGFKPTAFISVVVQVGQANPATAGASSFGSYGGP